ncbi:MAG: hypothetical protein ACUVT1_09280, partial [Anaerolineae bacterium]
MGERAGHSLKGLRLYQWIILATLTAAVIGAYGILIHLVMSRLHPALPRRQMELTAPADGAVVKVDDSIAVGAQAVGVDIYRIELWVDSVPVHVATRSLPADDAPWSVGTDW